MTLRIWAGMALTVLLVMTGLARSQHEGPSRGAKTGPDDDEAGQRRSHHRKQVAPYTADLFRLTEANTDYRRVLFTGTRSQLVVMSIPPEQSIGEEEHAHVEQTIVILSGVGQAMLDGKRTSVRGGDAIVVTPGTRHDIVNTGTAPLKLFTTYVPPNHLGGRVHATRQDAERDTADERFGEQVR
jgi:mannose-6-phosphate isomerase-like protein (cupin superfamily)